MGNLGGGEILVIMLVGLIVLGPKRLPEAARQIGRFATEVRKIGSGFQRELREAMQEPIDETKATLKTAIQDPLEETKATLKAPIEETKATLKAPIEETKAGPRGGHRPSTPSATPVEARAADAAPADDTSAAGTSETNDNRSTAGTAETNDDDSA